MRRKSANIEEILIWSTSALFIPGYLACRICSYSHWLTVLKLLPSALYDTQRSYQRFKRKSLSLPVLNVLSIFSQCCSNSNILYLMMVPVCHFKLGYISFNCQSSLCVVTAQVAQESRTEGFQFSLRSELQIPMSC